MNFHFTEEQELLRSAFAEFAKEEIAPNAAKWDADNVTPLDIMPKLGELGVLGIFVPEEYGGIGLGHTERVMALEEIARYSGGLGMMVFTHQLGMAAILDYGSEEQKKKYLPDMCAGTCICGLAVTEPGGGSDVAGQKTSAVLEGDNWVVNGRKCFITNSHCAGATVITCRTGEDEKGRGTFSTIIIEKGTEGFAPGREENKLGLRGSMTGELIMNNVKVPKENVVGEVGQGNPIAMKEIGEVGRASMAAIATGILRGCLEDAVKFANERIVYGKPIAKLQAIQFHVAEIRCDYEAARLMLYRAAALKDEGKPASPEFSMAKYFATDAACRDARKCIEVMGGYGVVNEYAAGRYLRDALGCISSGGTSEIQKLIVAGDTMRKFK